MKTSPIVFFGTPSFAVASLEALLKSGRKVPLVITQPDRPSGRGRKLSPPPVKLFCEAHGIPFQQPSKMKALSFHDELRSVGAPLFVVAAYGRILPPAILSIPTLTLNVHASLLPRWRGAGPIEHAILAGDATTGISIMRLVEEMDAGDILLRKETPIGENETAGELSERLAVLGGKALIEALDVMDHGTEHFEAQDMSQVTFSPPIEVNEAKLDWNRPALEVHHRVSAMNPRPGAHTSDGKWRIKIWRTTLTDQDVGKSRPGEIRAHSGKLEIATQDRWIEIVEIQREGKSRQQTTQFLAGYSVGEGQRWS